MIKTFGEFNFEKTEKYSNKDVDNMLNIIHTFYNCIVVASCPSYYTFEQG